VGAAGAGWVGCGGDVSLPISSRGRLAQEEAGGRLPSSLALIVLFADDHWTNRSDHIADPREHAPPYDPMTDLEKQGPEGVGNVPVILERALPLTKAIHLEKILLFQMADKIISILPFTQFMKAIRPRIQKKQQTLFI